VGTGYEGSAPKEGKESKGLKRKKMGLVQLVGGGPRLTEVPADEKGGKGNGSTDQLKHLGGTLFRRDALSACVKEERTCGSEDLVRKAGERGEKGGGESLRWLKPSVREAQQLAKISKRGKRGKKSLLRLT